MTGGREREEREGETGRRGKERRTETLVTAGL